MANVESVSIPFELSVSEKALGAVHGVAVMTPGPSQNYLVTVALFLVDTDVVYGCSASSGKQRHPTDRMLMHARMQAASKAAMWLDKRASNASK